ncbi:hypothetical protein ABZ319_07445 [Nocardia sp. NPDC005978]|uniref:hypothetical protein n=1 Tax=Nocardia sp. NPDC005978 TaxID=3156725 RepID=UPI0033A412FE
MAAPPAPPVRTNFPGRVLGLLATGAVVLGIAFVIAPRALAAREGASFGDADALRGEFRTAFDTYWRTGESAFPADLQRIVDYWFRYHLSKAVIAGVLLFVLISLTVLLWRAFVRTHESSTNGRLALGAAGVVTTALVLFAAMLVIANIQGAIAPFASLLPFLIDGPPDPALAETLDQVRQRLAEAATSGERAPAALNVMLDDFTRYHVVVAVAAALVAADLLALSVLMWRKSTAQPARSRAKRVLTAFGALSILTAMATIVVAVANTTNAGDPASGLAALFDGGW